MKVINKKTQNVEYSFDPKSIFKDKKIEVNICLTNSSISILYSKKSISQDNWVELSTLDYLYELVYLISIHPIQDR